MSRRKIVMVAVVVAAAAGAGLLLWRGEGWTGVFLLVALVTVVLLQLDARRRLSDLAADVRRNRAELRTLAARVANQESARTELTRQLTRTTRTVGQLREEISAVDQHLGELDATIRSTTPPPTPRA